MMNNRQLHKVHQAAISLFKEGNYDAYDPELQHIVCTILAYEQVKVQEQLTGQFKLEIKQPYEPID